MKEPMMSSTFGQFAQLPVKKIWNGVTARIVQSELVTMALVEVEPGTRIPEHTHVNEQLGFVLEGSLRFTVDGTSADRGPGDTWRIMSNVPHRAEAGPQGAVVVEVYSPVRADWAVLPDFPPADARWPGLDH
ncbi:cupin domain-containing protein [Actinomycetes bacterium KLBMP 9759]